MPNRCECDSAYCASHNPEGALRPCDKRARWGAKDGLLLCPACRKDMNDGKAT